MAKSTQQPALSGDRDSQQLAVYRAEKMAQHLLLGDYWTQTLTEIQVLDLIDSAINHPSVAARWSTHPITVNFAQKGTTAWAERATGRIHLPPGTRNPLTVLHEVSHLLTTTQTEADHGPGFVAIYRYVVKIVLGEDTANMLDACFTSLRVKADDALIPPAKVKPGAAWHRDSDIPGVTALQARDAADIVRLAAQAGMFGAPGDETRTAAFSIARRLKSHGDRAKDPKPPARIPETVTVPVAALLRANSRDDVAEIVLGTVRKDMFPAALKAPPLPKPKKKGKKGTRVKGEDGTASTHRGKRKA